MMAALVLLAALAGLLAIAATALAGTPADVAALCAGLLAALCAMLAVGFGVAGLCGGWS